MLSKYKTISFRQHLLIGLFIRLGLIVYGEIHDENSEVPYTDIDYRVVTDGARYVLENESPFKRHTYRYSPLLAYSLIPNILLHKCFGKLLFSLFDILIGILIKSIVHNEIASSNKVKANACKKSKEKATAVDWANYAALFWLYNPLSIVIATRGNGDSISSFFVLVTIYFIQKVEDGKVFAFLAGICHGIAIHLRIYPVIFSLALFLSLSTFNMRVHARSFWRRLLFTVILIIKSIKYINQRQMLLIVGTVLSLGTLSGFFYYLYGQEYLNEAYLYHFIRKDIRHNFSLYFLMQYLGMDINPTLWGSILVISPRLVILIYLSITFGWSRSTLAFCMFCQTFVMVAYNPVVTSQYFVWYLALLPLSIRNLQKISFKLAGVYFCMWILAQGLWLLPAYLLEFKTVNTFNFIGIQSVCFFFVNIYILQRLIYNFDVPVRIN